MKIQKKPTFLEQLFSSANLVLILVAILIFFLVNLGRTSIKYFSIKNEINDLEKEIISLEKENIELTTKINYFQSDFYKEKEAREKMNLKKPDEKVIIIIPPDESTVAPKEKAEINVSNLLKWWNYFFRPQP